MTMSGSRAAATTLGEVSERETLKRIFPRLPESRATIVGPGDDAAVLAAPDGRYVVTTDMMVHGPDFRWAWSTPYDLGWKAAATNLSDVAAMGAVPTALVVAIAAPADHARRRPRGAGRRPARRRAPRSRPAAASSAATSPCPTRSPSRSRRSATWRAGRPCCAAAREPGDVVAVSGALGAAGDRAAPAVRARPSTSTGEPDRARFERAAARRIRRPSPRSCAAAADRRRTARRAARAPRRCSTSATASPSTRAGSPRRAASASTSTRRRSATTSRPRSTGGEDHSLLATFPAGHRAARAVSGPSASSWPGAGLLVGGRPFDERGGWDPYVGWDGNVG